MACLLFNVTHSVATAFAQVRIDSLRLDHQAYARMASSPAGHFALQMYVSLRQIFISATSVENWRSVDIARAAS
jgi:hypothetical protein